MPFIADRIADQTTVRDPVASPGGAGIGRPSSGVARRHQSGTANVGGSQAEKGRNQLSNGDMEE
jgi:hypothetical protein